ncbi:hypothetical protein A2U01_0052014, partial [Trifolium medium]|nr:hypothetical protein [Trifolium medium]
MWQEWHEMQNFGTRNRATVQEQQRAPEQQWQKPSIG